MNNFGLVKVNHSRLAYCVKEDVIEFYKFDDDGEHFYVGRASKDINDTEFNFIRCELNKEDVDVIFIYVDSFKNNTL